MEILVCIGIILILIALIFPILTGAKLRAKETICIANLRQIYSAALMYRADFDANPPNNLTFPAWRPYLPMSIACGCPPDVHRLRMSADAPNRRLGQLRRL